MSEPTPQKSTTVWYYTNENGERIRATGGQLKGLARKGQITPDTIVELIEPEQRRPRPAGQVVGLFPSTAPTEEKAEPGGAISPEESSVLLPPKPPEPTGKNPFKRDVPLPPAVPTGKNPFDKPLPPTQPAGKNPFDQPFPPPQSGRSFGEIYLSMARGTMGFVSGAFGLITALILTVFVLVLLYNITVLTGTIPPPPAGHWLEKIIFFDISHIPSRKHEEPEKEQEPEAGTEPEDAPLPSDLPRLYPAQIEVTASDGTKLEGAHVVLHPIGGAGEAVSGTTNASGIAEIYTRGQYSGAPAGKYKVTVYWAITLEGPTASRPAPTDPQDLQRYNERVGRERQTKPALGPEFSDRRSTPLEIEVTEGRNNLTVEVIKLDPPPTRGR